MGLDFRSNSSRRCLRNPTQAKRRLEWGTLGNLASQEQNRSLLNPRKTELHIPFGKLRAGSPVGRDDKPLLLNLDHVLLRGASDFSYAGDHAAREGVEGLAVDRVFAA